MKVGSFNCRGLRTVLKKITMADDMIRYNLELMGVQETHIMENMAEDIISMDGRTTFSTQGGLVSQEQE